MHENVLLSYSCHRTPVRLPWPSSRYAVIDVPKFSPAQDELFITSVEVCGEPQRRFRYHLQGHDFRFLTWALWASGLAPQSAKFLDVREKDTGMNDWTFTGVVKSLVSQNFRWAQPIVTRCEATIANLLSGEISAPGFDAQL